MRKLCAVAVLGWGLMSASSANAMSLIEAVRIAVHSNPEIGEAIANREAIEFELQQGRGLFRPRVDLEARIGGEYRWRESAIGNPDNGDWLNRRDASLVVRQLLFDGYESQSEVERQAARVDGASYRVMERSEFVALAVAREYIDILRLRQVVSLLRSNENYHQELLGRINRGAREGSISVADQQQARERLFAAKARTTEAREELANAETRFQRIVGRSIGRASMPRSVAHGLPASLDKAIGHARVNHPSIKFARADLDAALALKRKADAAFAPKLTVEGRARAGDNLDGTRGQDNDVQANVVMSWNLYNGGINSANVQEQIRRADEARMALHRISREVEEGVRLSWDRRRLQARRLADLNRQLTTQNEVVRYYTEQFQIGQRSLLDLLDAQNSRVAAQTAVATGQAAVRFADYRVLASVNRLLRTLKIQPPSAVKAYAREQFSVPPTPPAETMPRHTPKDLNREPDFKGLY
jgi:adhesin transport system outer membrane protein